MGRGMKFVDIDISEYFLFQRSDTSRTKEPARALPRAGF